MSVDCGLITDFRRCPASRNYLRGSTVPRRSELRITKRTVDALTASAKDTVFWDRDLAGFGVRVQPTGRKTYVVQSRGPSGPKRITLGLHGDLSADEARKQAAVVIDHIKRGEDPVPVVPETELTVAALAERFMRVHVEAHCKPRTVTTYRSVLERAHPAGARRDGAQRGWAPVRLRRCITDFGTGRRPPMRRSESYRACSNGPRRGSLFLRDGIRAGGCVVTSSTRESAF